MPLAVFVAAVLWPRQRRAPERWIILERVRRHRLDRIGRRTDVDDQRFAAKRSSGQQLAPGFLAQLGDSERAGHGAQVGAGVAHHAA